MSETPSTDIKEDPTPAAIPVPEPATPAAAPKPEDQLAAARQEAAASYDRYTRAVADLENFRKRTLREKDELRQFATSGLMDDVIPILDNLGLGLAAAAQQTDAKAIISGVTLVLEQFKTTLARHGLKEVKPDGQRFDPHLHECISHQPSAEVAEEHVMQVVRAGYTLNGRLLRPASVIVSSGPAQATEAKS